MTINPHNVTTGLVLRRATQIMSDWHAEIRQLCRDIDDRRPGAATTFVQSCDQYQYNPRHVPTLIGFQHTRYGTYVFDTNTRMDGMPLFRGYTWSAWSARDVDTWE